MKRGFTLDPNSPRTLADFQDLQRVGAGLLRVGFSVSINENGASVSDAQMLNLLRDLEFCRITKRAAIVCMYGDFHNPAGLAWSSRVLADLCAIWEHVAALLQGRQQIRFELANEPFPPGAGFAAVSRAWRAVALSWVTGIRRADAARSCLVSFAPGGRPGFELMDPLPFRDVGYVVHMYEPYEGSHQGVGAFPAGKIPVGYPGSIEVAAAWNRTTEAWEKQTTIWNKARFQQVLHPVRGYQLQHKVDVAVTEFSWVRTAPGREQALADLIDIFNAWLWDWTYHCWSPVPEWDLERGADDSPRSRDRAAYVAVVSRL